MKVSYSSFAKSLGLIAIAMACSSSFTQAAIIAKWSFDEENGTTVHDSVGTYDGNLSPAGATFVPGGVSGGAINITKGLNGYVTMGNVLHLSDGDYSLVAWMKMSPTEQTPDSILLGKHAAYSRNGYLIHVNQTGGLPIPTANKVFFYQGGSGYASITAAETPVSTSVINDGQWHQIVAVHRAGSVKSIYVDGAPAEATKPSQSGVGNSVAFLIGGVNENGIPTGRLNATVDEVQIYNHALTDADIDYLFANPTAVALDCEGKAALLEAQLAEAQSTIANLQNELNSVDQSLERLNGHLQSVFRNPAFQIKGTTTQAVDNLVRGIEQANRGTKQNLYQNLLTQP